MGFVTCKPLAYFSLTHLLLAMWPKSTMQFCKFCSLRLSVP